MRYLVDRFDGNVDAALAAWAIGPGWLRRDGTFRRPGHSVATIARSYIEAVSRQRASPR